MINPIFEKSISTLERLMGSEELCLNQVFDRLKAKMPSSDPTPEITFKLLLRCRLMFDCRN